ncbi:Protein strubbelig-receptor family 7 [Cinnamomum micranthum f. kanehirae]|uniref:Protein strubbelig-receptor family 7 n=1 Tax=Cinnamomum micranthum f. kanehirae TaxID=337451 RepID=A0A443NZX0_9MAGN|nr:Protein strubbelig-receptor family 7 [Cinnamomum micranthum f. kanehirae]
MSRILTSNSFTGGAPQSISKMTSLVYLLAVSWLMCLESSLDFLSCPCRIITDSINVLALLPLDDLNVANNKFTGQIPEQLKTIKRIQTEGNSWSTGHALPTPGRLHGSQSASDRRESKDHGSNASNSGKEMKKPGFTGGDIAAIVMTALLC